MSLIQLLVAEEKENISLKELKLYINGHIGASPKTVKFYLEFLQQFELIEPRGSKLNFYKVNHKKYFFPSNHLTQEKPSEKAKNSSLPKTETKIIPTQYDSKHPYVPKLQDSKTLVNLDKGHKGSHSFKAYDNTWQQFVVQCKSLGLDVCYVLDAFLIATDEGKRLVSTPVHLGLSALIVNLILPYVVQKPRRRRRTFSYVEEES